MKTIIAIVISTAIGLGVAWAGGQGGVSLGPYSLFLACGMLAFLINWVAFIPANIFKTEKYYDLTGSITYLTVTGYAVAMSGGLDLRGQIVAVLVAVWAARLGSFLFARIMKDGKDSRFDHIKPNPVRFFMTWTLQGLWVVLTAACALAVITSNTKVPLDMFAYVGLAVWVIGFLFEAISDQQKKAFKNDPTNKGKFISSGLWAWSRHPNYFGEITLWTGIAIIALPVLSGLQWVTLISPVFVTVLLTKISGIPMLEKRADKEWGDDPEYQEYKKNTPVLVPRPPRT